MFMKNTSHKKEDHVVADADTVSDAVTNTVSPELAEALAKIETLEAQLKEAQEKERRSLADYQNLVRRTQEERIKSIRLANREIMEAFVQPFEHLQMAAAQVKDAGLTMVVSQLQKTLTDFGLEEIEVMGKEFDVETMEVVDTQEDGKKVVQVARKGYRLNGTVLQHAKVVLA